jgi:hypothetical protein
MDVCFHLPSSAGWFQYTDRGYKLHLVYLLDYTREEAPAFVGPDDDDVVRKSAETELRNVRIREVSGVPQPLNGIGPGWMVMK